MLPQLFSQRDETQGPALGCEAQSMRLSLDPGFLYYFLILGRHGTLKHVCQEALGAIAPTEDALVQHQLLAVVNECDRNWKTDFLNPLRFL